MKTFRQCLLGLTTIAVVFTACDDEENNEVLLTQTEAQMAFTALVVGPLLEAAFSPEPAQRTALTAAARGTLDETLQCDKGGTGMLLGSYEENSIDFTYTPNACVIPADQSGTATLTVNGDPNISFQGDALTLNIGGGFSFTHSDGREGRCPVDITVTAESFGGTICGRNVALTQ